LGDYSIYYRHAKYEVLALGGTGRNGAFMGEDRIENHALAWGKGGKNLEFFVRGY